LEVQKEVLQALSSCSLALPIVSTQVVEKIAGSSLEMVNFILGKLANQGAIVIRNVTIGTEAGCEIISVQPKELKEILEDTNDTCQQKEEEAKRKCGSHRIYYSHKPNNCNILLLILQWKSTMLISHRRRQ